MIIDITDYKAGELIINLESIADKLRKYEVLTNDWIMVELATITNIITMLENK